MRPFLNLLMLPLLFLTGCGGSASPVGAWQVDTTALDKSLAAMTDKMPADQRAVAKGAMDGMRGMIASVGFELKADGTATMTIPEGMTKHNTTGTWKQTGDQVTVTPNEKGGETKTLTLKNGKLSMKEKMEDGVEMEMVFERKK